MEEWQSSARLLVQFQTNYFSCSFHVMWLTVLIGFIVNAQMLRQQNAFEALQTV